MGNIKSKQQSTILFKDLNRDNLYKLFVNNNLKTISINNINELVQEEQKSNKTKYNEEGLLLINLMMNNDLDYLLKNITNIKYDYMIGFLVYLTSNPLFKYNFGYFIDHKESFNKILKTWNIFLNSIISDISSLPNINLQQHIIIEFEEILSITILKHSICNVEIVMENFKQIFKPKTKHYNFSIKIDNIIINAGKSNGSGEKSNLYKTFKELNKFIEVQSLNNKQLISLIHEN